VQRALLLLLVGASYSLFAGAPRWTLAPLVGLAVLAIVVAPLRTLRFPRHCRVLDYSLMALLAGLVVQIVPLPAPLVDALSPHAEALRSAIELRSPGTARAAFTTFSVDPNLTLDSLAAVFLGVASFWIARGVFSSGGSTRQFCRILAVMGCVAAVTAIVFRVVAPKMLFGVLRPSALSATPYGAFVNRNHFGGWMLMAVTPIFGYLIAHVRIHPSYRDRWRVGVQHFVASGAFVVALAAFVMTGALLLTLSRSAVVGLGSAALFGWWCGRDRLRVERTNLPAILAVAGVGLLAALLFVDIEGWTSRIAQELAAPQNDRNRLTIWRETLPALRDFWATGTGAGTFADAMLRYQESRVWVGAMGKWALFNNAHSHYLQVAAEGGLLLGLPALCAFVSLFVLARRAITNDRGEMFWTRIGAAAGLVGMAVQSIWETSLIMPANAVLCGTLMGLCLYQRGAPAADEPSTRTLRLPRFGR
jgi:O-antigen ligase